MGESGITSLFCCQFFNFFIFFSNLSKSSGRLESSDPGNQHTKQMSELCGIFARAFSEASAAARRSHVFFSIETRGIPKSKLGKFGIAVVGIKIFSDFVTDFSVDLSSQYPIIVVTDSGTVPQTMDMEKTGTIFKNDLGRILCPRCG